MCAYFSPCTCIHGSLQSAEEDIDSLVLGCQIVGSHLKIGTQPSYSLQEQQVFFTMESSPQDKISFKNPLAKQN